MLTFCVTAFKGDQGHRAWNPGGRGAPFYYYRLCRFVRSEPGGGMQHPRRACRRNRAVSLSVWRCQVFRFIFWRLDRNKASSRLLSPKPKISTVEMEEGPVIPQNRQAIEVDEDDSEDEQSDGGTRKMRGRPVEKRSAIGEMLYAR
jgi:hypothetical protein